MQYDFNLTAGGSQVIEVKGRFFKYKSGTGAIRVKATKGGFIDLLPGQGVWNVDFSQLVVQDKSGQANAGVILAGEFDFHDDRIIGTVDVVDGGRTRTNLGGAFYGSLGVGAVAGKFSCTQLWNPVGSGKIVVVDQISSLNDGGVVSGVQIVNYVIAGGLLNRVGNKKSGGPLSSAVGYGSNSSVESYITSIDFALSGTVPTKLTAPIVLMPGYGMLVGPTAPNVAAGCGVEFFEESV